MNPSHFHGRLVLHKGDVVVEAVCGSGILGLPSHSIFTYEARSIMSIETSSNPNIGTAYDIYSDGTSVYLLAEPCQLSAI